MHCFQCLGRRGGDEYFGWRMWIVCKFDVGGQFSSLLSQQLALLWKLMYADADTG